MPTWLWITLAAIVAIAIVASRIIKVVAAKKQAGESVGWLDIALAFAQGIDDAGEALPPDMKKVMTGKLKDAAEAAGKHADVEAFLKKFGFNKPKADH